jgi:hypothetical protein
LAFWRFLSGRGLAIQNHAPSLAQSHRVRLRATLKLPAPWPHLFGALGSRVCGESGIFFRSEVFVLSHLARTANGYTVRFRLGTVDVVRTELERRVFEDPTRLDRMLDQVSRTFQGLASSSDWQSAAQS